MPAVSDATHRNHEHRAWLGETLGNVLIMANVGKVNRVIREAVTVLVDELGHQEAADLLEMAVAQLRVNDDKPSEATASKWSDQLHSGETPVQDESRDTLVQDGSADTLVQDLGAKL